MSRARHDRIGLLLATLLASALIGCAKPPGMIFPPLEKAVFWPPPPEPTRIRYVGQLATSGDLKPAVPFLKGVGQALFGQEPVRSMLTPYALCTDEGDRLFVADSNGQLVHVFNLRTRVYQQWKPTAPAMFSQPVGIAWDPAGKLYVSDSMGGRIFVFGSGGEYLGAMGWDYLKRPCGLAFDAERGRLYVADTGWHRVIVLSRNGTQMARLGERGAMLGEFNFPTNVAVDRAGRVYVSDSLNFRVQQFDADLKPLRTIGKKGDMPGYFSQPKGVACDSQGHLYAVDAHFEAVQIFDSAGALLLSFGEEGRTAGEFWLPTGIFIDSKDRIWIADSYNRRVQVFDYIREAQP